MHWISNLSHEKRPIQILHRKEKELRNKKIPLVKVLWYNQAIGNMGEGRRDEEQTFRIIW